MFFFHHFDFLVKRQKRKAKELFLKRERLKRKIERFEKRDKRLKDNQRKERRKRDLSVLKSQYYSLAASCDAGFPPSIDLVLPTKFGNILRAAESYPGTRYGIDAVPFWPRLLYVIPDDYKEAINETRNELSFLVNCSLLSGIFFVACLGVILPQVFDSNSVNALIKSNRSFIIAGVIAFALAWFFNRASMISVGAFGDMIRSAYDLFRLDLLEHLQLETPKDSKEEFDTWRNLGKFIVLGRHALGLKKLKYHHQDRSKSDTP